MRRRHWRRSPGSSKPQRSLPVPEAPTIVGWEPRRHLGLRTAWCFLTPVRSGGPGGPHPARQLPRIRHPRRRAGRTAAAAAWTSRRGDRGLRPPHHRARGSQNRAHRLPARTMEKAARPQTGCDCRADIRGQVVRPPVLPDLPVRPAGGTFGPLSRPDESPHQSGRQVDWGGTGRKRSGSGAR